MSKPFKIDCRINEKFTDFVAYLKLQKGGITGYIESKFEEDMKKVSEEDWAVLKSVRRMGQK